MKKYVLRLMNLSNDFRIKFDLITTSTFFGYTTSSFHCNCKIIIVELYAPIETPSSNRYLCKLIFVSLGVCHQNQEVIEMKDKSISLEIFKIVMDSVQTGDLHVNQKSIFEVLAASQLQMASVVQLCCDFVKKEFIENRIDLKNYSVLCTVAVRLGLRDLQEAAEAKMGSMYKDVCESKEFLTHINGDQLLSPLGRDDLNSLSETFVFKSAMNWIRHKGEERMAVAGKVIGAVRLGLVDVKIVIES